MPRGFTRPGAVPPGASVSLHAGADAPGLARIDADASGGFELALDAGNPLEGAVDGDGSVWLRAVAVDGAITET